MQTFLPYAGFTASAEVLDPKRLGKQRVETLQVLRGLTLPTYGWRHHPAVKMWRGYEEGPGRDAPGGAEGWAGTRRARTTGGAFLAGLAPPTRARATPTPAGPAPAR